MAWQEVQPDLTLARNDKPTVKVRVTRAGLSISLHAQVLSALDWKDGTTLALLLGGGADAAGKIALKPKPKASIAVALKEMPRRKANTGSPRRYGKVYVGRFPQLRADDLPSEVAPYEQRNDQLIITLPDGWLKV